MFQTHGFPPELFETLAAERNLAFDWKGFQRGDGAARHRVGRRAEDRAVPPRPARRPRKRPCTAAEFLGYETLEATDAKVIGIIANDQLCDQIDEVDHEQPIVVVLDKTPFYGEMGGQVGDTGEIVGPDGRFEVIDTQIDGRLHAPRRPSPRRPHRVQGRRCSATVDSAAAAGDPPRPLGHAPAALRPAKAPRQARPAARLEGRGRSGCGSTSPTPRPSAPKQLARDRERGERQRFWRGEPVGWTKHAAGRGPEGRRDDALRREVSRRGPRGLDGRVQQGALRRHAPGEHGARSGLLKIIGEESVAAGTRRITALTGRRPSLDSIRAHEAPAAADRRHAARCRPRNCPIASRRWPRRSAQLQKQAAAGPKADGVGVDQLDRRCGRGAAA